jgi:FkbM family methyltransferase
MTSVTRRVARAVQRELFPTPEAVALRQLEKRAADAPRQTKGRLTAAGLDIEYVDAASTAPQWNDIFVRQTLDLASAAPRPRILDCGANIGLASLWFKRRFAGAHITAFEADPAICAVLRGNLERNGAADVEVVQAAVWTEDGSVTFRAEGADSGAVDAVAADTRGPVVTVPAVRLGAYLRGQPVDLLKLDIEGAELDVLADVESELEGVRAIHVEVHDFDSTRRLLPECLLLLHRAGFVYALDDFAVAHWRTPAPVAGPFRRAVPSWVVLVRAWKSAGIV